MPELPEVETIKRGLSKLIVGKTIIKTESDNPKSFPNSAQDVERFVIGSKITSVRRSAKVLLIDLNSDYSLIIHLKMTGQLVYDSTKEHFGAGHPTPSLLGILPDKSTRVTLYFKDGSRLYFNDQRKFGWMKLHATATIHELPFFEKVGPEPLNDGFTWQVLKQRLAKRQKTAIKPALMDQSVIAGVGNIYADESLWGAKLNPAKIVADLSDSSPVVLLC